MAIVLQDRGLVAAETMLVRHEGPMRGGMGLVAARAAVTAQTAVTATVAAGVTAAVATVLSLR